MKIIEFRAENIKNLKAIEIKPGADAVVLTGKNGAGKSAILDSIFIALTGKKMEQPIRNGEARAEINVDLGDYRIRRIFTEKSDRLEVLSKEGAAFKSPQTLLNTIFGDLSFDPLEFANMKEKPQRELLAQLVGLDFSELDTKRINLYNERTIRNRAIKGGDTGKYKEEPLAPLPLEALVGQMEVPDPATPREEVSMAAELDKVAALERMQRDFQAFLQDQASIERDIRVNNDTIADYRADIEALMQKIKALEDENTALAVEKTAARAPQEITEDQISAARENLRGIEDKNVKIRKAIEYDKKQSELKSAKDIISKLESDMMKIDLEKDQKIKAAQFPIAGLGITDECVIYNGKPFSQLSTGEQIRVSTAIAMALNPALKIILIKDGSLLDADGMKEITEIAKDRGYQLWLEKVADEKGPLGIYIENGEIV